MSDKAGYISDQCFGWPIQALSFGLSGPPRFSQFPDVVRSEAEGSAVPRTFRGNVFLESAAICDLPLTERRWPSLMGKLLLTKGTASAVPQQTLLMRALAPEVRLFRLFEWHRVCGKRLSLLYDFISR